VSRRSVERPGRTQSLIGWASRCRQKGYYERDAELNAMRIGFRDKIDTGGRDDFRCTVLCDNSRLDQHVF